jgi:hypothetical protein
MKRRDNPRNFIEDSDLLFSLFQSPGDGIDVLDDSLSSFQTSIQRRPGQQPVDRPARRD